MATSDPVALLLRLLREPSERPWLEFKHNNCNPDEIGRCLSACANAAILAERDRAFIVFGVEDGTNQLIGTTVTLAKIRRGNENLSNWLAHKMAPSLMTECLDFNHDGKKFAILAIEPTYDRPVRFDGIEYIRVGENIKRLTDFPDHERALWLATSKRKFESAIAKPHQSLERALELLDVDRYFELREEEKPVNRTELARRLCYDGFLIDDMEGGFDITNLGAILFAKSFDHFPSISGKSVRIIPYTGKDKTDADPEFDCRKGYAVAFTEIIEFAQKRLPKREAYERGIRRAVEIYPRDAVREIIANALIHQDFTIGGTGPIIEIYTDRVEVTNPGNSLVAIDRIIDERRSRNERLASAMRSLGMCEERGGGIDKAIVQIEEAALPAPWFDFSQNNMIVTLFGPKQFKDLTTVDKTWSCFCHCVIRFIRKDYMTNSSLRKRFGVADYQITSNIISRTIREGKIVPADPNQGRRFARYVPYWAR